MKPILPETWVGMLDSQSDSDRWYDVISRLDDILSTEIFRFNNKKTIIDEACKSTGLVQSTNIVGICKVNRLLISINHQMHVSSTHNNRTIMQIFYHKFERNNMTAFFL